MIDYWAGVITPVYLFFYHLVDNLTGAKPSLLFGGCKSHSYGSPDDPRPRTASQIGIFEVLLTTTSRLELCDGSTPEYHRTNEPGDYGPNLVQGGDWAVVDSRLFASRYDEDYESPGNAG